MWTQMQTSETELNKQTKPNVYSGEQKVQMAISYKLQKSKTEDMREETTEQKTIWCNKELMQTEDLTKTQRY